MRHATIWLASSLLATTTIFTGVSLALDGAHARTELQGAQRALVQFRAAVLDADVAMAEAAATTASGHVQAAEGKTDGPAWVVASRVPRFGATAKAVQLAVELAGASTQLAQASAVDAAGLIETGGAEFIDGGRIDTSALAALGARLDQLPIEQVQAARDALAALPASGLIGPSRAGRDEAVASADEALTTVDRARTGLAALAGFLGGNEPRSYLLAIQNPGELRGTGGLISYIAELTFNEGRMTLVAGNPDVRSDIADPMSRITEGGNSPRNLTPVDRSEEFAARYDHNAGGGLLQSVNLDPNLPTVAPVLLDLYAARGGRPLDGVIMVDPVTLQAILAPTGGPIVIDPALIADAPGMPPSLTSGNLAETLLSTTYDTFGGVNPARRPFEEAVTIEALQRLAIGSWEPVPLLTAMRNAAATRHLQVYSNDPTEQAAFASLGVAGELLAQAPAGDLLGVVAINAAPNKSDVHVGHRFAAAINLEPVAGPVAMSAVRRTILDVEVVNPLLAADHDTYIVGSSPSVVIGSGAPPRVDDALNRTWFQIWTPGDTQLEAIRDPASGRAWRYSNIHGHRAFDFFLETSSASTASMRLQTYGGVALRAQGDDRIYELTLWRQSKAIPDVWDLTIEVPDGWQIVTATASDGGAPSGLGVLGSGQPRLTGKISTPTTAQFAGAVTRDVHIEVRIRRS